MIAGFACLLLYFTDRERGMSEETKKELVAGIAGWTKKGGRRRNGIQPVEKKNHIAESGVVFLSGKKQKISGGYDFKEMRYGKRKQSGK